MEQRAAGQSHVAQAQLTQSSTAQSQAVLGGRQEQAHAEHGQDLDALALPPLVPVQRGAREGAPGAETRNRG